MGTPDTSVSLLTMIISSSLTTTPGTLACSMVVCATLDSVASTGASLNVPRRTIPWTKRPATSTLSGNHGAPMSATQKLCVVTKPASVTRPVFLRKVTPSSSASGTHLSVTPLSQLALPFHTIQLRNTPVMVLLLAISAVVVVHVTQALVSAVVLPVSLVPHEKRLQIFSKSVCRIHI